MHSPCCINLVRARGFSGEVVSLLVSELFDNFLVIRAYFFTSSMALDFVDLEEVRSASVVVSRMRSQRSVWVVGIVL